MCVCACVCESELVCKSWGGKSNKEKRKKKRRKKRNITPKDAKPLPPFLFHILHYALLYTITVTTCLVFLS